MSEENESAKGSQQEEEENPEPPLMVQKEQLTKGLSRIQRTHGKSDQPTNLINTLTHLL